MVCDRIKAVIVYTAHVQIIDTPLTLQHRSRIIIIYNTMNRYLDNKAVSLNNNGNDYLLYKNYDKVIAFFGNAMKTTLK
jgi:hypothetical protein